MEPRLGLATGIETWLTELGFGLSDGEGCQAAELMGGRQCEETRMTRSQGGPVPDFTPSRGHQDISHLRCSGVGSQGTNTAKPGYGGTQL